MVENFFGTKRHQTILSRDLRDSSSPVPPNFLTVFLMVLKWLDPQLRYCWWKKSGKNPLILGESTPLLLGLKKTHLSWWLHFFHVTVVTIPSWGGQPCGRVDLWAGFRARIPGPGAMVVAYLDRASWDEKDDPDLRNKHRFEAWCLGLFMIPRILRWYLYGLFTKTPLNLGSNYSDIKQCRCKMYVKGEGILLYFRYSQVLKTNCPPRIIGWPIKSFQCLLYPPSTTQPTHTHRSMGF